MPHGAGQCRYAGAGKGHRLSDRCHALLQGPGSSGQGDQEAGHLSAPELSAAW